MEALPAGGDGGGRTEILTGDEGKERIVNDGARPRPRSVQHRAGGRAAGRHGEAERDQPLVSHLSHGNFRQRTVVIVRHVPAGQKLKIWILHHQVYDTNAISLSWSLNQRFLSSL